MNKFKRSNKYFTELDNDNDSNDTNSVDYNNNNNNHHHHHNNNNNVEIDIIRDNRKKNELIDAYNEDELLHNSLVLTSMDIYVNKFLDKFINPTILRHGNDLLNYGTTYNPANLKAAWLILQLRNIVFIQILIGIIISIVMIQQYADGNNVLATVPLMYIFLIIIPSLYNIRFSDRPYVRLVSNFCMIGMFIASLASNMITGGVGKATLQSIFLILMAAFTTCRLKDAVIYCFLCVLQLIYIYILHVVDFRFQTTEEDAPISLVTSVMLNLLLFFVLLYRFVVSFHFYISLTENLVSLLAQQKLEAQEAQLHMTEYISRMSHEFRSPLHVILNLNEFAISEKDKPKEVESYLNDSIAVIKTLCVLVNDVLTYARTQHLGIELNNDAVDIPHVVEHVVNVTSIQKKTEVDIVARVSDDIKYMECDETRILQILFNLVSNAKKFTMEGIIIVAATIRTIDEVNKNYLNDDRTVSKSYLISNTKSNNKLICFEVIDSGIGIHQDKLAQVLMPFVQADSTIVRRFGGTGLGLSIVQQLVKAMKGCMWIQSSLNEGSTFAIAIPYKPTVIDVGNTSNPEILSGFDSDLSIGSQKAIDAKVLENIFVLVVDDNKLNRKVCKRLLQRIGIENVESASGADEALALIKTNMFDIVLLDLHMPEKSGYDCAREIRILEEEDQKHWLPLIAFTADVNPDIDKRCRNAGFNSILLKPANRKDLQKIFELILPKIKNRKDWLECINKHEKYDNVNKKD